MDGAPRVNLLAISGSLRAASSNTAALRALGLLAPPEATLDIFEGLGTLPPFNPDQDRDPAPPAVADLRRRIGAADGLVLSSPEYARGMPGVLKNALDWLVSGPEMPGKPVMLVNTSPRAIHAQASLVFTLETMSARVIRASCVTLPLLGRTLDAHGIAADRTLAESLTSGLARFLEAIESNARSDQT